MISNLSIDKIIETKLLGRETGLMEKLYDDVLKALQKEDKVEAVTLCLSALDNREIGIVDLYTKILQPALVNVIAEYEIDDELIWREHVRSGIIRTIIELAYPHVLQQRKPVSKNGETVIVMCPQHEDHELGAKMVADFFKLEGYRSIFIGANTPITTILKAIEITNPKYLCISATNYYNIVSIKKTIEVIKQQSDHELLFIVGGRAIEANPKAAESIDADYYLKSYEDIINLKKEEN